RQAARIEVLLQFALGHARTKVTQKTQDTFGSHTGGVFKLRDLGRLIEHSQAVANVHEKPGGINDALGIARQFAQEVGKIGRHIDRLRASRKQMLVKILPADAPDTLSVAQAEVSKDLSQRSRCVPWLAHETEDR